MDVTEFAHTEPYYWDVGLSNVCEYTQYDN